MHILKWFEYLINSCFIPSQWYRFLLKAEICSKLQKELKFDNVDKFIVQNITCEIYLNDSAVKIIKWVRKTVKVCKSTLLSESQLSSGL